MKIKTLLLMILVFSASCFGTIKFQNFIVPIVINLQEKREAKRVAIKLRNEMEAIKNVGNLLQKINIGKIMNPNFREKTYDEIIEENLKEINKKYSYSKKLDEKTNEEVKWEDLSILLSSAKLEINENDDSYLGFYILFIKME